MEHVYANDGLIHDNARLKELQALSLDEKIMKTQARIIEFYNHFDGNIYVSFSGGKDSTVLLDIVRKIFPDVPAVFSNTGLEYPEIQRFVKSHDNIDLVYPQINFHKVISTYGYPIISKEVSEAIYYARRTKSEGETVRKKKRINGQENRQNPHTYIHTYIRHKPCGTKRFPKKRSDGGMADIRRNS